MVHMIGQAIGAHTDATHGMTLSGVSIAYYRHILPYGLRKFARFATAVWGIPAAEISSLGVTENMLESIADATFITNGCFKIFTREDVLSVLRESL